MAKKSIRCPCYPPSKRARFGEAVGDVLPGTFYLLDQQEPIGQTH